MKTPTPVTMTGPTPGPIPGRRICFVAPFGLRAKGTVRARTLPLARVLAQLGNAVMVIIPPWDSPADAGCAWEDEGVRVVNVSLAGGILPTLARMARLARTFDPDILHIVKPRAHAGLLQWLFWQAGRLSASPRPRIYLDLDDWEQAWAGVAGYAWPVARFLAWQEEWGIRHAHGITAASHWLAHRARDYTIHTPILYLPNGVALAGPQKPPASPAPDQPPTILWFSRFVEVTPAWMGEFWAAIHAKRPDVRLLIVGEGIQPRHQEAMRVVIEAATVASAAQVHWLGYVDGPALADLLNTVDCAIFPAAEAPLNQAKCSVRLATTLMAGVPVVASAVGEQIHYGGEGAARLVPGDAGPADFAQAVTDLLARPQDRAALAAGAQRRLADLYSWQRLGAQLHGFYA